MSAHGNESESHAVGSTGLFITVWVWLAAITAFEVFLGYETERFTPGLMLAILVILSVVKAALIVSYFMHLKYEKLSLALLLIPSTLFCITMILIFFLPDGFRLLQMRLH
jgi:cytochrome c oxidase subunit IV